MNKKGNPAVFTFVILVLLSSVILVLLLYQSSGRIKTQISSSIILDEVYSQEETVSFYLKFLGERAYKKTYESFFNDNKFSLEEFSIEQERDLEKRFINLFEKNLRNEFNNYQFEKGREKSLNQLKFLFSRGDLSDSEASIYRGSSDENYLVLGPINSLSIKVFNMTFISENKHAEVFYSPEIFVNLSIEGFEEVLYF
jgi:hypothetical protein